MFQKHAVSDNNEESFNEIKRIFIKEILKGDNILSSNDSEWDLNKFYKPNHACIWNNIKAIGKKCIILEKDSQIVIIEFEDNRLNKDLLKVIYRLEDLSVIN